MSINGIDDKYEKSKFMRLIKIMDRTELEHMSEKARKTK